MLLRFHFRFCFRSVLKASLIALVLIVISLQTDGSCPKNCNGHGECSPYSSTRGWGTVNNGSATCECQANYRGPDCSISKSLVFFSLSFWFTSLSPLLGSSFCYLILSVYCFVCMYAVRFFIPTIQFTSFHIIWLTYHIDDNTCINHYLIILRGVSNGDSTG